MNRMIAGLAVAGLLGSMTGCAVRPSPIARLETVRLPGGIAAIEMVRLPAGTFYRTDRDTEQRRAVSLSRPFAIGKYEVTQAQFEALMGYNPSSDQPCRSLNVPVNRVTWEEAKNFCRKLTLLHREHLPEGYHFDLPGVDQWEYACCAGRDMVRESLDYRGNPALAGWGHADSPETPQPVGLKQPNRWGLHDMHGNVSEWCRDRYRDPDALPGAAGAEWRAVCGWNIFSDAFTFDALTCSGADAQTRQFYLGFRVALVPAASVELLPFDGVPNDLYDYEPEETGGR